MQKKQRYVWLIVVVQKTTISSIFMIMTFGSITIQKSKIYANVFVVLLSHEIIFHGLSHLIKIIKHAKFNKYLSHAPFKHKYCRDKSEA